jgi:hypothetical protein
MHDKKTNTVTKFQASPKTKLHKHLQAVHLHAAFSATAKHFAEEWALL